MKNPKCFYEASDYEKLRKAMAMMAISAKEAAESIRNGYVKFAQYKKLKKHK